MREKIGEGGFAAVHRAYQATLEREAVVKVLHARLSNRADVIQRFLRESRLASRLDHPYAAHVYAFGAEPDGTLWIAMELVNGTPMDKLLEQQGPISLDRFVPLFERICEVVQTAHERGIVHRDLKPANVMVLSRAGRLLPKLLDFGIARVVEEAKGHAESIALDKTLADQTDSGDNEPINERGETLAGDSGRPTRVGAVMGSPRYMAPEQWTDAGSVGSGADIYALGILVCEALTGRHPFDATTVNEVMVAHATATPRPLGPGLEALDPLIARALAKRSEDRYATAGDFAAAMRAATGRGDADVLPELEEPIRVAMAASAPQPMAEAVAALEAARNIDQACALVWDAVTVASRWIGVLALAARTKIGPGSDGDAHDTVEKLRALGRGDLADEEWIQLARSLTRPFFRRRDAYPIPELVGLLHGEVGRAETPPEGTPLVGGEGLMFVEAFQRLRTLRGTLDRRAGKSDEQRRELYAEALVALAELLRPLRFLLDYTVIMTRDKRAERWRGLRRTPRPALVRRARPLPEGEAYLLDGDGHPVLALSPLVQVASPAPGKDDELFVFAGHSSNGARLVAVPYGFELHDQSLGDWFREHLFDLTADPGAKPVEEKVPYRGLSAFTAEDSSFYFGREREIDTVVNRLRVEAFLAVVGPSGAGKSSFVQAGIVPRLPTNWRAIVVRPGPSPAATLEARLERNGIDATGLAADPRVLGDRLRAAATREGTTIALVIDQFEELFTLCRDADQRARYAEAIADAARSDDDPVRVVVTLRDDFLIRAEGEPAMRERLGRGLKLLTTPAADDLERILIEPARRVGYQFESRELATEMVAAVAGQPGALALLSFTAAELWKLRDRHFHQLSRKSYTAIGGVGGALARHAEDTLAVMSSDEQRLAREAFRHLVTAEGTRQVLRLAELRQLLSQDGKQTNPKRAEAVIDKLVSARLVVVSEEAGGDDRVEIIHEALLDAWPRLVEWRREDSEGARLRDQLRTAAKQWDSRGRAKGLLWRDEALAEYQIWRVRHAGALTDVETAFAEASVSDAARGRRSRRLLLASAFAALVVVVVGLIVFNARIEDERVRLQVTLRRQYEDEGRRFILEHDPLRALASLARAGELGATGATHDFLIAQAIRASDGKLYEVRHESAVSRASFSPDGSLFVTVSYDKQARIWNSQTGDLLRALKHDKYVSRVSFSPDQKRIITGSFDKTVVVWDLASGKPLRRFEHKGFVRCAQFSTDGTLALSAGAEGDDALVLWEPSSGTERFRVRGKGAGFTACALSRDQTLVAAGDEAGTIRVWDTVSDKPRHEVSHSGRINTIELAGDDRRILTSSDDKTAIEWDVTTGQQRHVFPHAARVTSARYSPDGHSIVTASMDRTAIVWDAATGKRRLFLEGHTASVEAVAFSPDGKYIVTGSEDKSAWLWDAATGHVVARWVGHQDKITDVAFDPAGQRVVTTSDDSSAIVWRVAAQQSVTWLDGAQGPIRNASFSRDGSRVLLVGATAQIWDLRAGTARASTTTHVQPTVGIPARSGSFNDGAASPDMSSVLTASDAGVVIWDVATGKPRILSDAPADFVAWSRDGASVLATFRDGHLRCWDATNQMLFENYPHPAFNVLAASFDSSGTRIITVADDQLTKIWSLDGSPLLEHKDKDNPIAATFDPSGTRVMSVIRQRVKIWNLTTRAPEVELDGHSGAVYFANWSPDGSRAITSSSDGTVRLWDTSTGDNIATLRHPGRAYLGFLSPAGDRILIAGEDGTAAIYELPKYDGSPTELEHLLRCRATRDRTGCTSR